MTHHHQHTLGDSQAKTPGAGKCVSGEWDDRFVCTNTGIICIYPLYIFFCLLIDASYRYNLLEGGSCSVHYYGRLGAVSVVCVWAGVGEALRWNWRHNDSLSPDPQTLARSSHSRGLFYLIGLIKLMLFQVVNTDYEILDISWIRFLVAAAWSTENWEMTVLLSVCLCFNVSLCHGTTAWYRLRKPETGQGH